MAQVTLTAVTRSEPINSVQEVGAPRYLGRSVWNMVISIAKPSLPTICSLKFGMERFLFQKKIQSLKSLDASEI
jgi:hypothetical protein